MPKNSPSAVQLLEVYAIGRKLRTLRTQKHSGWTVIRSGPLSMTRFRVLKAQKRYRGVGSGCRCIDIFGSWSVRVLHYLEDQSRVYRLPSMHEGSGFRTRLQLRFSFLTSARILAWES